MNLTDLRKTALGRYGLIAGRMGAEDALFPVPILADAANEKHRDLAERTRCYRETQTYDLPLGVSGLSTVALECNVIEIIPRTVRLYSSSAWSLLTGVPEETLRVRLGALDGITNGTPGYYFLRSGVAVNGQRVLEAYPGSDTATTDGLKLDAYIYPAEFSADTQGPALQPAEHFHLVPLICWAMAEIETSRGRRDAPLAYWQGEAERTFRTLKRIIEGSRRIGPRRVRHEEWTG